MGRYFPYHSSWYVLSKKHGYAKNNTNLKVRNGDVKYYKYRSVILPPLLGNARTMQTTMGIEHKERAQLIFVDRSADGQPLSYALPVQYTIKAACELSDNKDHDPISSPWCRFFRRQCKLFH
jgi:hypothetical protein